MSCNFRKEAEDYKEANLDQDDHESSDLSARQMQICIQSRTTPKKSRHKQQLLEYSPVHAINIVSLILLGIEWYSLHCRYLRHKSVTESLTEIKSNSTISYDKVRWTTLMKSYTIDMTHLCSIHDIM